MRRVVQCWETWYSRSRAAAYSASRRLRLIRRGPSPAGRPVSIWPMARLGCAPLYCTLVGLIAEIIEMGESMCFSVSSLWSESESAHSSALLSSLSCSAVTRRTCSGGTLLRSVAMGGSLVLRAGAVSRKFSLCSTHLSLLWPGLSLTGILCKDSLASGESSSSDLARAFTSGSSFTLAVSEESELAETSLLAADLLYRISCSVLRALGLSSAAVLVNHF